MPNAKDVEGGDKRIFAIGSGGAGKSLNFCTLPGRKFLYIFDPQALETIRGYDIDYEEYLPEKLDLGAVSLTKGKRDVGRPDSPMAYRAFEAHLEASLSNGFFDNYEIIGFDSMTTLSDIIMDRVMFLNDRFGGQPQQDDYPGVTATVLKILREVTRLKKLIYITGHVEFKQHEHEGKMMNTLALIGRLRYRMPLVFSDIWFFSGEENADKGTRWLVQTQPNRVNPTVRCSLRNLVGSVHDISIEDLDDPEGEGIAKLLAQG